MEDIQSPLANEQAALKSTPLCEGCQTVPALPGYAAALCSDCRQLYINYPIPKWIWLFAGGIAVLMGIGLFRMPVYVSAAMHLKRAENAIEDHRYYTAGKEAAAVLKVSPDLLEAHAYHLIASAYSTNLEAVRSEMGFLGKKTFEDTALLNKVDASMTFFMQFIPGDSLALANASHAKDSSFSVQMRAFDALPDDTNRVKVMAGYLFADRLYDRKEYDNCLTMVKKILLVSPDSYSAKLLQIVVLRQKGDFDAAIAICKTMLQQNKEDVNMIAGLSMIALKQKDDKTAAKYADQALAMYPEDLAALRAMTLVKFFKGEKPAAGKLLAQMVKEESKEGRDSAISTYVGNVINGTEIYR